MGNVRWKRRGAGYTDLRRGIWERMAAVMWERMFGRTSIGMQGCGRGGGGNSQR
jgi:hypothetical protein